MPVALARFLVTVLIGVLALTGAAQTLAAPSSATHTLRQTRMASQASQADPALVAAGGGHTCALTTNNSVKCWGDNSDGQLGDGTRVNHPLPALTNALSGPATALVAGLSHTCALIGGGGAVQCWGNNSHGELGDGTFVRRQTPTSVNGLPGPAVALAAGTEHTCAVLADGKVFCWGNNLYGQLDGSATGSSPTPVNVPNLGSPAREVVSGTRHSCALLQNDSVQCWGNDTFGQLGEGPGAATTSPVQVINLPAGLRTLAAGAWHTCALAANNAVLCWGRNHKGQIGNNSTTNQTAPVNINNTQDVTGLSLGSLHSCALLSGGGAQCWGDNQYGQLGDGTEQDHPTLVSVSGLTNVLAMAAGGLHNCALLGNGSMRCWGFNYSGQLGDGSIGRRTSPLDVVGLSSGVATLIAASAHTCARMSAGGMKCWGLNSSGQLGDNTQIDHNAPVDVLGLPGSVSTASADGQHSCSVVGGALYCWGNNSRGQLGDASNINKLLPVAVSGLGSGVTAVVNGDYHTCALTSAGAVKCWGANTSGQLGNNNSADSNVPVDVNGLNAGVASISAGSEHSCARLNTGALRCWGSNAYGQLGDGSRNPSLIPIAVSGFASAGAASIHASEAHTCTRTSTGGVKCWGDNTYGQLGNGNTLAQLTPSDVSGLSAGVSAVSAGRYHNCALLSGAVRCWGDNQFAQLGDGTFNNSSTPVNVLGLPANVGGIGAGGSQTCVLINGGLKCWGNDLYGQVGDGPDVNRLIPVGVSGFVEPRPVVTVTPLPTDGTLTPIPSRTPTQTPTPPGVTPGRKSVLLPWVARDHLAQFAGPLELAPNDLASQANGPLQLGLDYAGLADDDSDYFWFRLPRTGTVTLTLLNHPGAKDNLVQLQLRDSSALFLDYAFKEPFVVTRNLPAGDYFARIFFANGPYTSSATYTVRVDFQ